MPGELWSEVSSLVCCILVQSSPSSFIRRHVKVESHETKLSWSSAHLVQRFWFRPGLDSRGKGLLYMWRWQLDVVRITEKLIKLWPMKPVKPVSECLSFNSKCTYYWGSSWNAYFADAETSWVVSSITSDPCLRRCEQLVATLWHVATLGRDTHMRRRPDSWWCEM